MAHRLRKGQANYREKQKAQGKKPVSLWIAEDDKHELQRIKTAVNASNQHEAVGLLLRFTRGLSEQELRDYLL